MRAFAEEGPPPDDVSEIRQEVFSATFTTSDSRDPILLVGDDDFAKQEYHGYRGPVLRLPRVRDGFPNVIEIDVETDSPAEATARITDWEGNMAASSHRALLKRIRGKWVVVEFRLTWIS